jgi:hypothetical protein
MQKARSRAYAVWKDIVNKKGGIYVKEEGKKLPVEMVFYDDQSEPGTAVRIYEKLITQDKVDLIPARRHSYSLCCGREIQDSLWEVPAASVKLREMKTSGSGSFPGWLTGRHGPWWISLKTSRSRLWRWHICRRSSQGESAVSRTISERSRHQRGAVEGLSRGRKRSEDTSL